MIDWQIIAVSLIVLAAGAYTARRALARLRSFRLTRRGGAGADSSCATGCGSCGGEERTPPARAEKLVQIDRSPTAMRRHTR